MIVLLAAMVAFMVWAIGHTNARRTWWQDERDAEQFIAELHEDGPRLAFGDDVVAVAMLDGAL